MNMIAEAKELLRNAEYADGSATVLTQDCEALEAAVERSDNIAPKLAEALRVLVDHAQERYPHFESDRGQRDIAAALAALAEWEAQ